MTSARTLDVNRFAADVPVVYSGSAALAQRLPFFISDSTYRVQSLYTAAMLTEAGLKSGESIFGFSFQVAWSIRQTVHFVRMAIGWLPASVTSVSSSNGIFFSTNIVHGPEDITRNRLDAGSWLSLPCDLLPSKCIWDGTSNLVVELSYNMHHDLTSSDLSNTGQLALKATAQSSSMVFSSSNPASKVYPFNTQASSSMNQWVMKLRIVRNNTYSDNLLCSAQQSLVVEPVPTVYKLTGFQSVHPAYGFYVASAVDAPVNGALVYRYVTSVKLFTFIKWIFLDQFSLILPFFAFRQVVNGQISTSTFTLTRKLLVRQYVWVLSYQGADAFFHYMSPSPLVPPSSWREGQWLDAQGNPASALVTVPGTLVSESTS